MAITYKVLGQVNPSSNTLTTLYTTPSLTNTVVSTFTACNLDANTTTFSLAVRPSGAAINNKHYINYNISLAGNDTITATLGLTLSANDVVSVNCASTLVAFGLYGSEIV
jgi:hypothetical protein